MNDRPIRLSTSLPETIGDKHNGFANSDQSDLWPIELCHGQWSWPTFKDLFGHSLKTNVARLWTERVSPRRTYRFHRGVGRFIIIIIIIIIKYICKALDRSATKALDGPALLSKFIELL